MTRRRDLTAGLIFMAIGAAAAALATPYESGTARQMGPGYVPVRTASVLCVTGLLIALRALWRADSGPGAREPERAAAARPLMVVAGVGVFAALIERAGLVVAAPVLLVMASLAEREHTLLEIALLAIGLTAAVVVVFVWGLGLPVALLPRG